jgi:DNA-binding response OmpR family regulator
MDQPTILVVEDNPDHVAMIEAVFARGLEQARIHVAFRGQGAKRYLRGQWVAYEDDIDYYPLPTLVVLDLWLPDTTGLDILEWMAEREWLSEIPVIVFTASTDPDHFQRAYELGARRCLSKPTEFGELVEVVRGEIEGQAEPMVRSAAR